MKGKEAFWGDRIGRGGHKISRGVFYEEIFLRLGVLAVVGASLPFGKVERERSNWENGKSFKPEQ